MMDFVDHGDINDINDINLTKFDASEERNVIDKAFKKYQH